MTTCYDPTMPDQNDSSLINFIATTVEALRSRVDTISDQMATKYDLARLEQSLRADMATKGDLAQLEQSLRADLASKGDLARLEQSLRADLASKGDLARLESTLDSRTTAIRGDIEQVHIRLDSIDRGVDTRLGQVETDISRIRSVLYLLVKDRPDMLRLLGRSTSDESRPQG